MPGSASMKKNQKALLQTAGRIRLLIADVDGVLTDGSIILDNKGNEYKAFHVRDGHGIVMLMNAGIRFAIITGRKSRVVERRAKELGITDVYQNCRDKRVAFEKLLKQYSLNNSEVAYIGDDIVDIPIMSKVGLPVAVADADAETKKYANIITKNRGGRGAVREITDFLLQAAGLWEAVLHEYRKA